ncbi:MAG TPA: hypothetical protein VFZ75_08840 [Actinomycetota bacterium]|nr:hypothetical protein [Actinomycetota bacterium]
MPELWSVHATDEACDLAMRAPRAGRVAPDEVFVAGPIADDLRRAIMTVDPDALLRDASQAWAEVVLAEGGRDTFARLSGLRLPDGEGYIQGDVARVAVRVFVHGDAVRLFVPAYWATHLLERVRDVEAGP